MKRYCFRINHFIEKKRKWLGYYTFEDYTTRNGINGVIVTYHEASQAEKDRAMAEYMRNRLSAESDESKGNSSDSKTTLLNRTYDIIQLIVGISVGKSGLDKIIGAHAFLMYIEDPYGLLGTWQNDVMLDASGSYGAGTFRQGSTNLIIPVFGVTTPATITIDAYRRFWFTGDIKQILHTYTYIIDKAVGSNIRTLIFSRERRTRAACALEASGVLDQSGLFPGIKVDRRPIMLKRFLDNFTPQNNEIIVPKDKSSYELDVYP